MLRGQSLLVAASKEARQHLLGTQHNVSLLENGGRISLIFHFEEDLSQDEYERLEADIIGKYGGPMKTGQIGVTTGGKMDVKELGTLPKDMDFANLQAIAQKAVALQYDVPLPLVTDSRQTEHNYGTAVLALYDDAVLPLSVRILGGLSEMLLPRYGMDPREAQIIANQDSVTALVMRRNEELAKRKAIGIESDNELRALIGREPYEGGDVILKPANLIPAGSDIWTDDNAASRAEAVLGSAGD
jgi:phage portal protein BeeE